MTYSTSTNFEDTYPNTVPHFDSLLTALNAISSHTIESLDEISLKPVSGGNINEASLVTLSVNLANSDQQSQQLFLKRNTLDNAPVLFAEVTGLTAIRATGSRTCKPLAFGIDEALECSFLLLSVIQPFQGSSASETKGWHDLALQLATLHQAIAPQPNNVQINKTQNTMLSKVSNANEHNTNQVSQWYAGWFEDTFIGSNVQRNNWTSDWHEFFASQRLGVQAKMAFDKQLITRQTLQQIERLQHKLQHYLPNYPVTDHTGQPRPSLLHGDLWAGNAMLAQAANHKDSSQDGDGALGYLIDPAVYVGHPETDLALTQLFGGFTSAFYEAYLEYGLVEDGFAERLDIYNLYHYLNHLNLFGSSYLNAVQRIAQRFSS